MIALPGSAKTPGRPSGHAATNSHATQPQTQIANRIAEEKNMENMVTVTNLVKNYGDVCAVDNLSFSVQKGEIFGLLGPNGAGKRQATVYLN